MSVHPSLRSTCAACGHLFTRDSRVGRPHACCPVCRRHAVPGDLRAAEIERRYQDALEQGRAEGRYQLTAELLWHNCSSTPRIDRGPDTEVGVKFPEAW